MDLGAALSLRSAMARRNELEHCRRGQTLNASWWLPCSSTSTPGGGSGNLDRAVAHSSAGAVPSEFKLALRARIRDGRSATAPRT